MDKQTYLTLEQWEARNETNEKREVQKYSFYCSDFIVSISSPVIFCMISMGKH